MNDDLLRHGLIHIVSQAAGIQLVGELRYGADLAERLRDLHFDLLVVGVDASLPLVELIAQSGPRPKVIAVLDDSDASRQAVALLRAGVDALIHRRSPSTELLSAVQRVLDGQTALDPLSSDVVIAELRCPADEPIVDGACVLTRREQEVLALLTDGLDNRTIAKRLFIAEATVKFHLHNIMEKFGVHKRAALVSAALRGNRAGKIGPVQ
ncbi:response regulator transcription factor [soil metagenome]